MAKKSTLQVKGTTIRTLQHNGIDYICITDIARQKNPAEPKDRGEELDATEEHAGIPRTVGATKQPRV